MVKSTRQRSLSLMHTDSMYGRTYQIQRIQIQLEKFLLLKA